MKKPIFLYAFVCICNISYAQVKFEKGYLVFKDGSRNECFIKNYDWKSNPSQFIYRLSKEASEQTGKPENVKEFSVPGYPVYRSFNVQIDQSSDQPADLSTNREPEFVTSTVFLKLIAAGAVSLYEFENKELHRYFIRQENGDVQALIHKSYRDESTTTVLENNTYKNQLRAVLNSEKLSTSDFENAGYFRDDLVKLVNKFNGTTHQKTGSGSTATAARTKFNLAIRPGLAVSNMHLSNILVYPYINTDFGNEAGGRVGAEAELILPFNRNKWGLIFEPAYQVYKSSYSKTLYSNTYSVDVDYKSVELNLGVRHYFYFSKHSAAFLNATFLYDLPVNATLKQNDGKSTTFPAGYGVSGGGGFKWKIFSAEARYYFPRIGITPLEYGWTHKYESLVFVLGFTLFSK